MELSPWEVLRRPLITEKNTLLTGMGKYTFEVHRAANKPQIKKAVETAFNVAVVDVNTMWVKGKMRGSLLNRRSRIKGRQPDWKKAIVTLAEGDRIAEFESQ